MYTLVIKILLILYLQSQKEDEEGLEKYKEDEEGFEKYKEDFF